MAKGESETVAGNITYRGNNKFRFRVSVGSGPDRNMFSTEFLYDGKIDEEKIKKKEYPRAVETALAKFVTDVTSGQVVLQSNITFRDFVDVWKKEYAEREDLGLSPKTLSRYNALLERILDAVGHIKLQKISPSHLNSFYVNLSEPGVKKLGNNKKHHNGSDKLSTTTIRHYHELISGILGKAVQWGYILSNPAQRADPPKYEESEKRYLEEDAIDKVMNALSNEPLKYQCAILLDIFSGLRRSELMGLEWKNIDFDSNVMVVNKASIYISGKGTFTKDTKNKSSKRQIKIPVFVMKLLKKHQLEQRLYKNKKSTDKARNKLVEDNDFIFIQRNGKPMHPDTVTKWFPKFLKKNNLSPVNFHGLRHTNASLTMSLGFDAVTVASRLGHARKETTLNIYSHMFKSKDQGVADEFDKKYGDSDTLDTSNKQSS